MTADTPVLKQKMLVCLVGDIFGDGAPRGPTGLSPLGRKRHALWWRCIIKPKQKYELPHISTTNEYTHTHCTITRAPSKRGTVPMVHSRLEMWGVEYTEGPGAKDRKTKKKRSKDLPASSFARVYHDCSPVWFCMWIVACEMLHTKSYMCNVVCEMIRVKCYMWNVTQNKLNSPSWNEQWQMLMAATGRCIKSNQMLHTKFFVWNVACGMLDLKCHMRREDRQRNRKKPKKRGNDRNRKTKKEKNKESQKNCVGKER